MLYLAGQVLVGYLLADFIMGIFHWIKDTYFGPFTPIIGKTFIWGSRLHHARPRHVIEFTDRELFTSSALWTLSWMAPLMYMTGISIFNVVLFLTICVNDIVHKYAHMLDTERPYLATLLQQIRIIQSHDDHYEHHVCPHEINYCPITPYVNPVLEKINFWKRLENIVQQVFRVGPREKEYDFIEDPLYPGGIKFLP